MNRKRENTDTYDLLDEEYCDNLDDHLEDEEGTSEESHYDDEDPWLDPNAVEKKQSSQKYNLWS